jgi:HK97 family phage prohead protease
MKPIAVRHTATSDASWDGPVNQTRLKAGENLEYYRSAFAWEDANGNPLAKTGYKFIHHEISESGEVGPANIEACRSAIAVLNGARTGLTIPEADRKGVYDHLAAHLKDAGIEAPALRSAGPPLRLPSERRAFRFDVIECRAASAAAPATAPDTEDQPAKPPVLIGYAAVFDSPTILIPANAMWDGSPEVREVIERGAFDKTLSDGGDCSAVWNHNTDIVLGRRGNGTVNLTPDEKGLKTEIFPPDTDYIADVALAPIIRGDVHQMSFCFQSIRSSFEEGDNFIVIHQYEVRLLEVSPCTIPAYTDTEISARSLDKVKEFWQLRQTALQSAPGHTAHPEHVDTTRHVPGFVSHPAVPAAPARSAIDEGLHLHLDLSKRKLRLAA